MDERQRRGVDRGESRAGRGRPGARAEDKSQFIELLFAKGSPAFIAMSLRPKLNTLTLSAAQWQIVAKGAKELGNNALLSLAERKQREA